MDTDGRSSGKPMTSPGPSVDSLDGPANPCGVAGGSDCHGPTREMARSRGLFPCLVQDGVTNCSADTALATHTTDPRTPSACVHGIALGSGIIGAQRRSRQVSSNSTPVVEDVSRGAHQFRCTCARIQEIHDDTRLLLQPPPSAQQRLLVRLLGYLLLDGLPRSARGASPNGGATNGYTSGCGDLALGQDSPIEIGISQLPSQHARLVSSVCGLPGPHGGPQCRP